MRCRASSIIVALLIVLDGAIGKLRVAYRWKQIDYEWPNNDIKRLFPDYKQEDNLPLGLEVAGDRLFVTVPRWRQGVAASLNYIRLNGDYSLVLKITIICRKLEAQHNCSSDKTCIIL